MNKKHGSFWRWNAQRQNIPLDCSISSASDILRPFTWEVGSRLRAMVLFGDIKTSEEVYDIDLLKVIEGWAESYRVAEFGCSLKAAQPQTVCCNATVLPISGAGHPAQDINDLKHRAPIRHKIAG